MTRQNSDVKNRFFCLRPYLFSFTSRQVLVRLSLFSRSLFVSLSKTYRGPNEEQAKNERKSNEYRSRCRRETIGNSTICHRHGWQNTLLQPQTNILPLTLLLPRQIAALPAPLRTFSRRIKPFPCTFQPTTKAPHRLLKHIAATPPNNLQRHTLPVLNTLPQAPKHNPSQPQQQANHHVFVKSKKQS